MKTVFAINTIVHIGRGQKTLVRAMNEHIIQYGINNTMLRLYIFQKIFHVKSFGLQGDSNPRLLHAVQMY